MSYEDHFKDTKLIEDEQLRLNAFDALGFAPIEAFYLIIGWNMVWIK
jgi:hypothetical protein